MSATQFILPGPHHRETGGNGMLLSRVTQSAESGGAVGD